MSIFEKAGIDNFAFLLGLILTFLLDQNEDQNEKNKQIEQLMDSSYALQKKLVTLEENIELLQEENDRLKTSFQQLKSQNREPSKPGPPGPPGIAGPPGPISSIDIDVRDLMSGPDLYFNFGLKGDSGASPIKFTNNLGSSKDPSGYDPGILKTSLFIK